jgi:hypothetical protein
VSGFGAHYKGDVSEVVMGQETSLFIEHNVPRTWTATTSSSSPDFTEIQFVGTSAAGDTSIFEPALPILKIPLGMLIGQKMTFHSSAVGTNNFSSYYYTDLNSKVYTIIDHTLDSNSTKIKIVPALTPFQASVSSGTGDAILIHSTGLPTVQGDINSVMNTAAELSKEVSLIDGFVGLASYMTLPDTKVDLHSYYVVGLGRQVAVQQTGKVHHMGGAIEMPLHSPKWLFYSLGREVVSKEKCGERVHNTSPLPTIVASVAPGQGYIDVLSDDASNIKFGTTNAEVGDYLLIKDTTKVPMTTYKTPELDTDKYWPPESSSNLSSDAHHFEWSESNECRRISAIESLGSSKFRLYVDGNWQFEHTTADILELRHYRDNNADGSPHVQSSRQIDNHVHRLLFSSDTIPSFCLEHSVRTRDAGSFNATNETTIAPGSAGDTKQLTRIFRGCKIVEYEISSTIDAELKYRAIFDALSCFTDTGRLESANKGDRYTAHRMFQNTADTLRGKKASGIAKGSEKPFMFYNGSVTAFDQNLGLVSAFELRGKTGVEVFHTIQSNPVAESVDANGLSLKQVPYGGTRNASIIREGREQFEMEVTLALQDAALYHELRTHTQRGGGAINTTGGTIMLHFTKPTTAGSDTIPSIRIIIDDYIITDLAIPVPDDKGLLFTTLKLKPQNVKVISEDTIYHC